jgi:hypothetical protein
MREMTVLGRELNLCQSIHATPAGLSRGSEEQNSVAANFLPLLHPF